MKDLINWCFTTKLGHFLFNVVISSIICGALCLLCSMPFLPGLMAILILSVFFAATDCNTKLY